MRNLQEPVPAGPACIPNIGTVGRDRRLKGGLVWLVAGMALTVAGIIGHLPPAAFAGLYVVFFMAALGYFQASQKT
jgi:hypothetical protein